MMISRSKAVTQVVGFMSMENGLFFAAVVSTYGMPMVVELGVAFDVLVAAVLFGVFFFQIRARIDSLDVDRLNRLTEIGQVSDALNLMLFLPLAGALLLGLLGHSSKAGWINLAVCALTFIATSGARVRCHGSRPAVAATTVCSASMPSTSI